MQTIETTEKGKRVTLVLDPKVHKFLKRYARQRGLSMQGFLASYVYTLYEQEQQKQQQEHTP